MFIIPFVIIASTFKVLIQAAPAPVPGRGGHGHHHHGGRGQNQSVQGYGQSQWTQSGQSGSNQGNFGSSVVKLTLFIP
ncbi:hypothetical protein FRB95_010248 [Tulasnella sp. JGI-2019a]|nr:hypothetical protein FRB95_010248 [Tulasnella sp. JGI-2019a]